MDPVDGTQSPLFSFRYAADELLLVSSEHPAIFALRHNLGLAIAYHGTPDSCYALVANENFTCAACSDICAFVVTADPDWGTKDEVHGRSAHEIVSSARTSRDPDFAVAVQGRYLVAIDQCHMCIGGNGFHGPCHLVLPRFSGAEMTVGTHRDLVDNLTVVSSFIAYLNDITCDHHEASNRALAQVTSALAEVNKVVNSARVKGEEEVAQQNRVEVLAAFEHLGNSFHRCAFCTRARRERS